MESLTKRALKPWWNTAVRTGKLSKGTRRHGKTCEKTKTSTNEKWYAIKQLTFSQATHY